MIAAGKGFVGILDDDHSIEDHRSAAQKAVSIAKEKLTSGNYDIVILDEIHYALNLKLITLADILDIMRSRPPKTTLVKQETMLPKGFGILT
jgi:cob(I)alamin adenosyltransferase